MQGQANPLDLAAKLHQRSIGPRAAAVGPDGPSAPPLVVDLDPTTFCDLACPECISATLLNHSRLRNDQLLALCAEIAASDVRGVIFIGGGEPLLHQSTPAAMELLCDAGVQVAVVTNGTHLKRIPLDTLSRLAWIRVSVDAGCQATFDLVRPSRGRSAFPKVLDGIRHAISSGAKAVGYSFVVLHRAATGAHTNIADIPLAAELARELGCSYLELKAQLTPDHFIDPPDPGMLDEIRAAVGEAEGFGSANFAVLRSSSLRELLRRAPAVEPKSYRWCPTTQLRTLVTPTGIYVCAYHRGNDRFRIGDLTDMSFGDAWASADLGVVDPSADCRFHCARDVLNRHCLDENLREQMRTASAVDVDPFI